MQPTDKAARIAGWIYASMVFTAPFSLLYVPSAVVVKGDPAATSAKVVAHEMMFRLGIAADLIGWVIFIYLAVALYRLFREVNGTVSAQLVGLVLVSSAVGFLNVLNHIAALTLFRGAGFLSVLEKPQRDVLGYFFMHMYSQGIVINELFWGLWLFPFGWLVIQSRFFPRILGVLLLINGLAYVVISLTSLILPRYAEVVGRVWFPAQFGELFMMLWLVIKGAKVQPLQVPAQQLA